MFDSELDRKTRSVNVRRRAFLGVSVSAIAGAALWSLRKPRSLKRRCRRAIPGKSRLCSSPIPGSDCKRFAYPKW